MGKWASLGLLLLLCGMVVACGGTPTPAPGPVAPEPVATVPAEAAGPAVLPNLLVESEGEVWLRRVGWSEFLPAGFGIAVQPGDLLRIMQHLALSTSLVENGVVNIIALVLQNVLERRLVTTAQLRS